ncbi:hypothetical protein JB92DRAFT_2993080 [Gautieria morchelliformis]|nr:hypothetical protein JB92DRAFT_2993080 [Gautieria morchelliformis]
MATPHPHYPQPGPSSIPYHPHPPAPYTFGGHSYQHSYQPPVPILPNNAGRVTYPHQVHGPSPSTFHPFHPPQPYQPQPGPYPTMERPHHQRPPQSPYQQQHLVSGAPLSHPPSGLRQGPFIHGTAQRQPPPPFSTSALQLSSEVQSHPSPTRDTSRIESSPPGLIYSESILTSVREVFDLCQAFPDRKSITKGLALQSRRPLVMEAVPFTVSSAARPPQFFYDSLAVSEEADSPMTNKLLLSPPLDVSAVTDSPDEPDSPPQRSLASSATTTTTPATSTATSTAPHTPTPGSPHSSMTSVSLHTKSPAGVMLEVLPSASVSPIAADSSAHENESLELPQEPPARPSSDSTPTPPVKKTWASLLRPTSNGLSNPTGSTSPNSLPTSSVQGFSVPAHTMATPGAPLISRSGPDIVTLLTAPNTLLGRVPPVRTRGIVNLGNMCFANTVLQVLVYCPPFNSLFTELDKHMHSLSVMGKDPKGGMGIPLVKATVTFLKEFRVLPPLPHSKKIHKEEDEEDKGRDSLVPSYIYDALKETKRFDSMRGGQQEDAEEFLGFYLDTLEEELLSLIKNFSPASISTSVSVGAPIEDHVDHEKPADGWVEVGKKNKTVITRTHNTAETPISRIFGGKFRTALKVPGARESAMVDPWSRLQLDIQPGHVRTIEDALRNIATPGTVHVTSSSRPGNQVDASQQTLIEALPPILVLHLKRFLYDTTVNDVVKLNKEIAFGTELDFPKEILAPARRSRPVKYKLFGVLNHHGGSATGGHYTLDVLHPDPCDKGREGWIRIDDEFVQNIRAEDLPVRDVGDDRSAYLLFYRRVHMPGSEVL